MTVSYQSSLYACPFCKVREIARETLLLLDALQEYGKQGGVATGWPAYAEGKLPAGRGASSRIIGASSVHKVLFASPVHILAAYKVSHYWVSL